MAITIAKGQIALVDLNDVQAAPTQPTGAQNGSLWLNTTDNQLYIYLNGSWQLSTKGLQVGGTNLLLNSKLNYLPNGNSGTTTYKELITDPQYGSVLHVKCQYVYQSGYLYAINTGLKVNDLITVSFFAKSLTGSALSFQLHTGSSSFTGQQGVNIGTSWGYYSVTIAITALPTDGNGLMNLYLYPTSDEYWIQEIQVEKGSIATSWSPATQDTQTQIDTVNSYLNDLANDSQISRFERSVVRQMINDITGLWLNPTDSMPTLATIDSSGIGKLYSTRKAARDIGADVTPGTNYTNVGTAYTTLANYLNGLSPKPWDTTLTTTGSTPVTPATWNADWKAYNDSFNLLTIDVQDRQKAYTDAAQQNAINAVQNSVAHQTTAIANPSFTINAPIATLGLPEFQGAHIDSWVVGGNLAYASNMFSVGTGAQATGITPTVNADGTLQVVTTAGNGNWHTSWWSSSTDLNHIENALATGDTYTISFTIKCTAGSTGKPQVYLKSGLGYYTMTGTVGTTYSRLYYTGVWNDTNAVGPYLGWSGTVGTFTIKDWKIEKGTLTDWSLAPEETWATNGNRIKPITNPTFSTGTSLKMNISLYGDGTNNDSVAWDSNGNIVKTRKWQDDNIGGSEGWVFGTDATGYKQVKVPAYAVDVTNNTVQAVKHNGALLSRVTTFTAADQVALSSSDNTLYISIADTDSGWGESYSPAAQEIAAYFLGWRMCNGTYNTNYTAKREVDTLTITHAATAAGNLTIGLNGTNYTVAVANGDSTATIASKISAATFTGYSDSYSGSVVTFTATQDITTAPTFSAGSTGVTATISTTAGDVKQWYPVGDTDTSRVTSFVNGVPTTASPSIGNTKNYYQVVYQVGTPTQVTGYTFDGVLALIQGNNTVNVSYPSSTPSIVTGTVKYATNLATSNQDLTYIIPTIQTRLASAESKVTKDAIVNTVTQSVSYQTDLSSKADSSSLSNYATQAALNTTNSNVTSLNGTVNGISGQLSTFVTTTQETADIKGVKESFYQSGGMNLAYNSVGYDYNTSTKAINFWTQYNSPYNVTTVQNNDLYNLGFGSGFYYAPNGQNKGITQDINVVPGQHYTLSWYLNKLTSGGDSTYRFFIQILENGTVIQQIADNSGTKTNGYQSSYMQYTASANVTKCTIRFIGYANVEAYISGIMFTIGDTPIQWTLATGESYNTNIRMNINGIVVSQLDANGNETGYTQITPSEFAGYHTSNNGGTFEKVFYLNGDETVTKKITATTAITMGNIQILPISGASNTGWVFIPNN